MEVICIPEWMSCARAVDRTTVFDTMANRINFEGHTHAGINRGCVNFGFSEGKDASVSIWITLANRKQNFLGSPGRIVMDYKISHAKYWPQAIDTINATIKRLHA